MRLPCRRRTAYQEGERTLGSRQPQATEDCIHEEMDYSGLPKIETRDTVQVWLPGDPVIKGSVWCWNHRRWEEREEEA